MIIHLSDLECDLVQYTAKRYQERSIRKRRRDTYGGEKRDAETAWDDVLEGTGAELAFAKATNRYFKPRLDPQWDGDVGRDEVRWTRHTETGRLIWHPPAELVGNKGTNQNESGDKLNRLYFFATGKMPMYEIHGGILGARAMVIGEWGDPKRNGRWAYWVKRCFLKHLIIPPNPSNEYQAHVVLAELLEEEQALFNTMEDEFKAEVNKRRDWFTERQEPQPRTREHIPGR